MTTPPALLLDSDVFIAAKNAYYAFDLSPGFWKALLQAHRLGRVRSIDRVRNELLSGRKEEDLVQWVNRDVPREKCQPIRNYLIRLNQSAEVECEPSKSAPCPPAAGAYRASAFGLRGRADCASSTRGNA